MKLEKIIRFDGTRPVTAQGTRSVMNHMELHEGDWVNVMQGCVVGYQRQSGLPVLPIKDTAFMVCLLGAVSVSGGVARIPVWQYTQDDLDEQFDTLAGTIQPAYYFELTELSSGDWLTMWATYGDTVALWAKQSTQIKIFIWQGGERRDYTIDGITWTWFESIIDAYIDDNGDLVWSCYALPISAPATRQWIIGKNDTMTAENIPFGGDIGAEKLAAMQDEYKELAPIYLDQDPAQFSETSNQQGGYVVEYEYRITPKRYALVGGGQDWEYYICNFANPPAGRPAPSLDAQGGYPFNIALWDKHYESWRSTETYGMLERRRIINGEIEIAFDTGADGWAANGGPDWFGIQTFGEYQTHIPTTFIQPTSSGFTDWQHTSYSVDVNGSGFGVGGRPGSFFTYNYTKLLKRTTPKVGDVPGIIRKEILNGPGWATFAGGANYRYSVHSGNNEVSATHIFDGTDSTQEVKIVGNVGEYATAEAGSNQTWGGAFGNYAFACESENAWEVFLKQSGGTLEGKQVNLMWGDLRVRTSDARPLTVPLATVLGKTLIEI